MECANIVIQLEIFETPVFLFVFVLFFYVPQPTGGGHIDFSAGPFRVGVGVGICVRLYIVCTISCELVVFRHIKNRLDFGDLDLIFKVTAVEKLKTHGSKGHFFFLKTLLLVSFYVSVIIFHLSSIFHPRFEAASPLKPQGQLLTLVMLNKLRGLTNF